MSFWSWKYSCSSLMPTLNVLEELLYNFFLCLEPFATWYRTATKLWSLWLCWSYLIYLVWSFLFRIVFLAVKAVSCLKKWTQWIFILFTSSLLEPSYDSPGKIFNWVSSSSWFKVHNRALKQCSVRSQVSTSKGIVFQTLQGSDYPEINLSGSFVFYVHCDGTHGLHHLSHSSLPGCQKILKVLYSALPKMFNFCIYHIFPGYHVHETLMHRQI